MHRGSADAGVRIYDDHRDNLTVDVQSELLAAHVDELRHEHSAAALLWNVFRTLQRLDARLWLPRLVARALPEAAASGELAPLLGRDTVAGTALHWWTRWDLPASRHAWLSEAARSGRLHLEHYAPQSIPEKRSEIERRLAANLGFEDPVEVPLVVETPLWLLGIAAVGRDNLRRHTTFDARRDAVLRLLDAGVEAAGRSARQLFTLVLVTDARSLNAPTVELVERYRGRPERLAAALPHRTDAAGDVARAARRLGVLRWKDLGALLLDAKQEERLGLFDAAVLDELVKYLARKDVGFNFFRRLK
jgi:hypothetical protein